MREINNTSGFTGFKLFCWAQYCLEIDNLRKKLIPGYDPSNISPEDEKRDKENFERYYAVKYGKPAYT